MHSPSVIAVAVAVVLWTTADGAQRTARAQQAMPPSKIQELMKQVLPEVPGRETRVDEIMSSNLTTTQPNEPVENCLRMMTEKHIRHLPVVEEGKLTGVISIGDLVKHVIASQSATIAHLENYIQGGYSG